MTALSYRKKTILLIVVFTLARCVVACCTELGNDEVYYRMFASCLQWNYFDHPPMVAWLIRITTVNLLLDNEFFIRLGAIASAAISTWVMYLCGKKIANDYTGFLAAGIYSAGLYFSVIAGVFILPDSPQMICWTTALYLLLGICESRSFSNVKKRNILLFGIITGLGMLCKIHTIFLWFGFVLYVIMYNRKWLHQPVLYIAAALTLLLFLPVIRWNFENEFVTYFYHSGRVNIAGSGINLEDAASFTAGQILYSNPVIFVCLIVGLIATFKKKLPVYRMQKRILLLTSLPMIALAFIVSFFKPVLPHWTGPAYTSLVLLTAFHFSGKGTPPFTVKRIVPLAVSIAWLFQFVILAAGVIVINYFPGTFGKNESLKKGDGDFTLDMYGWKNFALQFESILQKNNTTSGRTVIVTNKWFPAAHFDYYVARPLNVNVFAAGEINEIHQYYWMNEKIKVNKDSADIYLIIPSNYYFNSQQLPFLKGKIPSKMFTVVQNRNGKECRKFYIWYFEKGNYAFDQW